MDSKSAVAQAVKQAKSKQDPADIQAMVAFYGQHYQEVYLIHCLNCKRVIGVECAPPIGGESLVTDRRRALFTYQDLCLSVRQRQDSNGLGEKMMGYECICGNRTLLSPPEKGIVAEQTVTVNKLSKQIVDKGEPMPASSPFELAKSQQAIDKRINDSGYTADYELSGAKERHESFMLERVK
jgi:hypothetical protein